MRLILQDTYKTKKTQVILRLLLISGTCTVSQKIGKISFSEPWFEAPHKGTFHIVYKSRNNSHVNREVIKALAGIAGSLNSENKVDHTNPLYTVVVEVIKAVRHPSVVEDSTLFRKCDPPEVVKS